MSSVNPRVIATRAVAAVQAGRSLDDALPREADGFTRALAYGVLRDLGPLDALLTPLLRQPPPPNILALLLCGIYQLRSMDVAAHAALNETVEAVVALGQPKLRGLVNAVLRRYQRERAELEAALPQDDVTRSSHPRWLVQQIRQDWPAHWQAVLAANNQQGPLTLRVNRRRSTPEHIAARVAAMVVPGVADALTLAKAVEVAEIPGFTEGEVSVQDASAQLAADLLDLHDGQRVLDACAAPGGKTAHILERVRADLLAIDLSPGRMARVEQTLSRLTLAAQLKAGDAARPSQWWDRQPFDRILLDAPCSGTGVIRRHPDIKWLRRATDIPRLADTQLGLLRALWPLLAPGGVLVYAVCSVLRAEADAVIGEFLKTEPRARKRVIEADWGEATAHGRRIAPGGSFDGFYYSVLTYRL